MSQQGLRQASFQAIGGTTGSHNEDAYAAFEAEATVPAGTPINGAFILWLQARVGGSTPVNLSGGTVIGNFTTGTAAFDGVTSQAAAACALRNTQQFGFVGKTLAAPFAVGAAVVYGSNDAGFVTGANPSYDIDLWGKNGTAPANGGDGTLLGEFTFTDTADESAGRVILSANHTVWDHVWVAVNGGSAVNHRIAEIRMFTPTVNLPGLLAAFAAREGATNWPSVGSFDPLP
jgi:hypothetical protein